MRSLAAVLALLLLTSTCVSASVLMEVSFDLALQQESNTGYTASHSVGEYVKDPNLKWMRYLNTLVSGVPGRAPMRTALFEFPDYAGWAKFEQSHLERTHVLYDLFWINWRKTLWEGEAEMHVEDLAKRARDPNAGGYILNFRYAVDPASQAARKSFFEQGKAQLENVLNNNPGFIERRAYKAGVWQNDYTHMITFEFADMESLHKSVWEGGLERHLKDGLQGIATRFASTISVPSAGSHGGRIFNGGSGLSDEL
jgi:hypothetical protein